MPKEYSKRALKMWLGKWKAIRDLAFSKDNASDKVMEAQKKVDELNKLLKEIKEEKKDDSRPKDN